MTNPIFRPSAAADIERIYKWYEDQRVGLGNEFLEEVSVTVDAVLAGPRVQQHYTGLVALALVLRDGQRVIFYST